MQYRDVISRLHHQYLKEVHPHCKDDQATLGWRQTIQMDIHEFARLIGSITSASHLNLTLCEIDFEFNHIGIVLRLLRQLDLIRWSSDGALIYLAPELRATEMLINDNGVPIVEPDVSFDQDTVDSASRCRTVQWIAHRFAYASVVRIALIGDDDLLSIPLGRTGRFDVTVVELDERICEIVQRFATAEGLPIRVLRMDVRATSEISERLDTFYTDPPYTIPGTLSFVNCGLRLMEKSEIRRFFVRTGRMHIGSRQLIRLQELLASAGAVVSDILPASSSYPFHPSFARDYERKSALARALGLECELPAASRSTLYEYYFNQIDDTTLNSALQHSIDLYNYFPILPQMRR